ncbi:MAG: transglycosylase domain-containing protein [Akkermansia muciniphila]
MQLAKITYNHRERNLHSKLTEVALAKRIEATYTKDEILETYINRIFWGHTFLGIAAAARGYYDKEPRDLSLAECATLAGIIYGPNDFSPIKHPEEAKKVRDIVLGLLKNEGKITEVQYQAALAEPIATRTPQSRSEENYAMGLVRRELDAILEEEDIRLGGLVVHTTLDLDLQNATLDAINKHMDALEARKDFKKHLASLQTRREKRGILKNKLTTKAEYEASLAAWKALPAEQKEKTQPPMPNYIQSAAVVMDNATGALLAVVGGRDAEESKLNRAIQSRRQTGSLFKPFIYATFFQQGNSADTRISDDRIAYGEIRGAANWSPAIRTERTGA